MPRLFEVIEMRYTVEKKVLGLRNDRIFLGRNIEDELDLSEFCFILPETGGTNNEKNVNNETRNNALSHCATVGET